MIKVIAGFTYDIYHYDFTIVCNGQKIPYQITFDRDLHFNRTNVILLNLTTGEDNECFTSELREVVCGCFLGFFEKEPSENVYFEIDLSFGRNIIKFLKFYRWSLLYPDFTFKIEITERDEILYAGVTITKKP